MRCAIIKCPHALIDVAVPADDMTGDEFIQMIRLSSSAVQQDGGYFALPRGSKLTVTRITEARPL